MMKKLLINGIAALCFMGLSSSVWANDFGSPEEAKAMLERAITAMQADEASALAAFNEGAEGFKDRDLYVFCGGPDGMFTAHGANQALLSVSLKDLQDKAGKALGEEIYATAQEGEIAEVDYMWPRPGEEEPTEKVTYVTKVGDQVCAVGYYKQ
ncbi:MAG: chemotaxis protein [Candidatus Competibacteraceae bacterium]|nr:MAG: chemotaxis protein [Candidatus Competibacteraceae bacterium]